MGMARRFESGARCRVPAPAIHAGQWWQHKLLQWLGQKWAPQAGVLWHCWPQRLAQLPAMPLTKSGGDATEIQSCRDRIAELQTEIASAVNDHKNHNDAYRKEELARLKKIAGGMMGTIPCTGCRYCCPGCPVGLNIPLLFVMNALFGMKGIVWTQVTADIINVMVSYVIYHAVCGKIFSAGGETR